MEVAENKRGGKCYHAFCCLWVTGFYYYETACGDDDLILPKGEIMLKITLSMVDH